MFDSSDSQPEPSVMQKNIEKIVKNSIKKRKPRGATTNSSFPTWLLVVSLLVAVLAAIHMGVLAPLQKRIINVEDRVKQNSTLPRPADADFEYTYDDFEWKFNCYPLHHVLFDPDMSAKLDKLDVRNDLWYTSDPELCKKLAKKWGPFIDEGSHEARDREYMVVKYSSPEIGYGVFAKKYFIGLI